LTAAYEALRDALIEGAPCPEGTAAIRYHGMLHGLPMLVMAPATRDAPSSRGEERVDALPASDELVRLLANFVLRTHSELAHVY
jgi:hypothetical protein